MPICLSDVSSIQTTLNEGNFFYHMRTVNNYFAIKQMLI